MRNWGPKLSAFLRCSILASTVRRPALLLTLASPRISGLEFGAVHLYGGGARAMSIIDCAGGALLDGHPVYGCLRHRRHLDVLLVLRRS